MRKNSPPLTEKEKQTKPLAGEIDPKNARVKAAQFAEREKASIRSKKG